MASSSVGAAASMRRFYRELLRLAKDSQKTEVRSKFRQPLQATEQLEDRLKEAESRLSFLRMTNVKTRPRGDSGRWIYRNGERLSAENGTLRDSKGNVVSNWDGNNLDPDSVKRHRYQLRRMGFVNNAHAKGIF